jgi:hypothetical protein
MWSGAAQDAWHLVPVKPDHSVQVLPHDDSLVVVAPTMQQILPALLFAQSMVSEHCQSIEPVTGHAVPAATHVDGIDEPDGVSQQCSPAAQLSLAASAAWKGQ